MWTIIQPPSIHFGTGISSKYSYPSNSLIITSKGAISRGWIDHIKIKNFTIFDKVESNPSFETVDNIISEFKNENFSSVIGLGGGSSLDVAKYVAYKMKKIKYLIPTTFGSGSEVTRISVLKVNDKKRSFHHDELIADVAIVDPFFLENTPIEIRNNSLVDACAQCTEAYDSKNSNHYTKFLCQKAFDLLEDGLFSNNNEKIVLGSLISGLGFGNSSTTLGHALSYVYSNENYSHGHALAFTTTVAHKFNNSKYFERFFNLVKKLNFKKISLEQKIERAAELIYEDRKHLDNNPIPISKKDIIFLLEQIQSGNFDLSKNNHG
jgi:succinate semialdehyde reductase